MSAPALPAVHGSHLAELARQAALPYQGTPHPLARARHAAAPARVTLARPSIVAEFVEASKLSITSAMLLGLFLGGLLAVGLVVLLGIAGS